MNNLASYIEQTKVCRNLKYHDFLTSTFVCLNVHVGKCSSNLLCFITCKHLNIVTDV